MNNMIKHGQLVDTALDMMKRANEMREEANKIDEIAADLLRESDNLLKSDTPSNYRDEGHGDREGISLDNEMTLWILEDYRPVSWNHRKIYSIDGYKFGAFVSRGRQNNYFSIIEWLATYEPDLLLSKGIKTTGTLQDEIQLAKRCKDEGIITHTVEAPRVLKDQGVDTVNTYPVFTLLEWFDCKIE